ncbi:MAG: proton-conducting transporter membrane subunit [Chloroflexota bacterium]
MLLLPLGIAWLTAVLLIVLNGRNRWVGCFAIAGMTGNVVANIWLAITVLRDGPQQMVAGGWEPGVGITLRADALGVTFAVISTCVLLAALIFEVIIGVHERRFPALVLFIATGLTGLFLTGDVFNFYVFFEIAMTASFALAGYGMRPRETRAALTFTIINLIGSVLFVIGIASLYHVTGTLDMQSIAARTGRSDPTPLIFIDSTILIGTLIFVAFSIKIGLFPFHFWLPPVYRDTWPAVAAIFGGAVANIGSYGLLRFGAEILPHEREVGAYVLIILGTISIIYGAHQAVSARRASEALAYSSISQAGYIIVALGIGGPIGFAAAILFTIVNSMNKTVLFLSTGLRGWLVGVAFVIGAFSVAGVPPSAGFFGKAAIFHASIATENILLIALLFLGGGLSFVYMFQIYQRDFWERNRAEQASPFLARMHVLFLAALILVVGIWPEPMLAVSEQAASVLTGDSVGVSTGESSPDTRIGGGQ